MNLFPTDTSEKLEFDKVKALLLEKCISENGKLLIKNQGFSTDVNLLNLRLKQVSEMKSALENGIHFPAQNFFSLEEELKALSIAENVLETNQFQKIASVVITIQDIFKFFSKHPDEYHELRRIISKTALYEEIIQKIDSIIDGNGQVKSDASKELISIRRKLNGKHNELQRVFSKIAASLKKKGLLAEAEESIRNNRRVLSVQAENKRAISGIIHDESDSGKTSYIEPQETVLLNNEVFELERAEKREIYKILKTLTATIATYKDDLKKYTQITSIFDSIRAKALLAIDMEAYAPILENKPYIELKDAKHPLLYLQNKKKGIVTIPLSVKLNEEKHLLLISGPNAGGKSVALKTIGLIQMMIQFGMLIPCNENSKIGLFEQIFTDLGDNQSIEDELSTYSSRLNKMKYFLDNIEAKTLFLIDEFGTGTDPRFGAAMAEAILVELIKSKAFGVVTTHYSNLKKMGEKNPAIINAAMIFNESNFSPTYQLKTGMPGNSYTFAIAEKSGLSTQLIEKAKNLVDYSDLQFDELIQKVESERKKLEKENTAIKKENAKLKELSNKFSKLSISLEAEKEKLRQQFMEFEKVKNEKIESETRAILNKINYAKSKKQAALDVQKLAQQKRQFIQAKTKDKKQIKTINEDINVGDQILHISTQQEGEVLELRGNKALVNLNGLKTKVSLVDLEKVASSKKTTPAPQRKVRKHNFEVESQFDIRGLTQDEARLQVENYIDQSLYNNIPEIKIIQGKGTGVLRKLVLRIIKEYQSNISNWRFEDEKSGGDGATIIEFK